MTFERLPKSQLAMAFGVSDERAQQAIDTLGYLYREPAETSPSQELRRLIVAARNVAFDAHPSPEALKELDAASEAFAGLVPWDSEPGPTPESLCSSYLACCVVGVVPSACEHNARQGETS